MAGDERRGRIRSFLSGYLRDASLEDDEDLFASGRVNSLFAMELVLFVEEQFKVAVENEDLDLDNFRSIDAIVGFIERKQA
jgi:acyl carrier protein